MKNYLMIIAYCSIIVTQLLCSCVASPKTSTLIGEVVTEQATAAQPVGVPTITNESEMVIQTPLISTIHTETKSPTSDPTKIYETRKLLLQKQDECEQPCFWGIAPNTTTITDAKTIFDGLNSPLILQVESSNANYYYSEFSASNGVGVNIDLIEHDHVIEFVKTDLALSNVEDSVPTRSWLAFSPETIISKYGTPSYVDLFFPMGPSDGISPYMSYILTLYYDELDLILEYVSSVYIDDENNITICPLNDNMDGVSMWFGRQVSDTPQKKGIPLKEVSSISIDDFSSIMQMENKIEACIYVQKHDK